MKHIAYISAALVLFVLASCTKIIDVNIDNAPAKFTIVGKVVDSELPVVTIHKTVEVDQNNTFPEVGNATVVITDNQGNSETLMHKGNGEYVATTMMGKPGNTYNLEVKVDGETFTSTSTMPMPVPVDSITTREFGGFSSTAFVVLHYTDPAQMGNNYRAILYVNDTLIKDIFIEDDLYINGNAREAVLFSGEYELDPLDLEGEKVRVEINCIDRPVYEYFVELIEVDGAADVAAPSNPKSNINGGAVGYFSAQTRTMLERTF